jgi:probable rRNA maturation factor
VGARLASVALDVGFASHRPWVPSTRALRAYVEAALPARRGAVSLSIQVVGAARSQRLNTKFRGKHKPTNVLSFAGAGAMPDGSIDLGELVICAPLVAREARQQGKSLKAHWAHLTVHGVLHLQGMDHERPSEALKMEAREVQILDQLGFSDPYA